MKVINHLVFAGLFVASAFAAAQEIKTTVNGSYVYFPDVRPMMIGGRVMVPLRGVFEHMGATVFWDSQTQTVIAKSTGKEVRLPIGSTTAYVNGQMYTMDAPARLLEGRTMVPLRFTAESLDATVNWLAESQTVQIQTTAVDSFPPRTPPSTTYPPRNPDPRIPPIRNATRIAVNTVLPFRLETALSSRDAVAGDRFTATLDADQRIDDSQGLPAGTRLEGHVDTAKPRDGRTPGVLGLEFDRVILPDGRRARIQGDLIGLDANSVESRDGRLVARENARKTDLKYVGYGAGAGVLLSILGKGDLLTNALIGGALGYLASEIERDRTRARDVSLEPGTRFGVRLSQRLVIP